jgi:pimeloyl-ACP methyl ester carboxylesterase
MKLIEFQNKQDETLRGIIAEADSDIAVVFVHGFERTTVEPKFKNFIDRLRDKYNLFQFDFTGTGLSDGDFANSTLEKLTEDLDTAVQRLSAELPHLQKIHFISHSLGCVAALLFARDFGSKLGKIIALAPAYNQKELQRFWFSRSMIKKQDPLAEINFANYKDFLDESAFTEFCHLDRMAKAHFIKSYYCEEVEETDYQILFNDEVASKTLVIHSVKDDKVPFESNNQLPETVKVVRLEDGDHDLEKPAVVERYLDQAIEFLTN